MSKRFGDYAVADVHYNANACSDNVRCDACTRNRRPDDDANPVSAKRVDVGKGSILAGTAEGIRGFVQGDALGVAKRLILQLQYVV